MYKLCKKCNTEKEITEFYKDITHKDHLDSQCKICSEDIKKQIRSKTAYEVIKQDKQCTKCLNILKYTEFNKDKNNLDGLYPQCKSCRKNKSQKYYIKNKENIIKTVKIYYKENKEKCIKLSTKYTKERSQVDVQFRLQRRLRNRLYYALKMKSWKKHTKFAQYIGCSLEELKIHLENQFQPGMTWDNYGKWHLDHIKCLDSATTEEELYKLCHYTNLQPLWALDNIIKSNKF